MSQAVPQGNETILVVDDEEALQALAKEQLENLGYTVLTAGYGLQALQVLEKESAIKLLISDVVMPGMNGFELAEQVMQKYPQLKILLVSGYTDNVSASNAQTEFFNKVLSKPYKFSELAQRVSVLLNEA